MIKLKFGTVYDFSKRLMAEWTKKQTPVCENEIHEKAFAGWSKKRTWHCHIKWLIHAPVWPLNLICFAPASVSPN